MLIGILILFDWVGGFLLNLFFVIEKGIFGILEIF